MQNELRSSQPPIDIEIIGINEADPAPGCQATTMYSAANATITAMGDIPWLQDFDVDQNCQSDLWTESWGVAYRDVIILDGGNAEVGLMNLTSSDLRTQTNYDALKQLFLNAAAAP
ncbi:MAG: hypothetical protein CMP23_16660 [Rickettsiales bacterium]|nr:hypothetical protein [Rickettsiales bacterium]|tara:strand:- start:153 stop:500 length:348 start_codon:yes stop_codon:yes gene_type:complete